jgi:hypothetical protein
LDASPLLCKLSEEEAGKNFLKPGERLFYHRPRSGVSIIFSAPKPYNESFRE